MRTTAASEWVRTSREDSIQSRVPCISCTAERLLMLTGVAGSRGNFQVPYDVWRWRQAAAQNPGAKHKACITHESGMTGAKSCWQRLAMGRWRLLGTGATHSYSPGRLWQSQLLGMKSGNHVSKPSLEPTPWGYSTGVRERAGYTEKIEGQMGYVLRAAPRWGKERSCDYRSILRAVAAGVGSTRQALRSPQPCLMYSFLRWSL